MKHKNLISFFPFLSRKYSVLNAQKLHELPSTTSLTQINHEFLTRNPQALFELKLPDKFSMVINQEITKYLKSRTNNKLGNIKYADIENFNITFLNEMQKFPILMQKFSLAKLSSITLCTGLNIPIYQDHLHQIPFVNSAIISHPFGINHHNLFGGVIIKNLNGEFTAQNPGNFQSIDLEDAVQIINPHGQYASCNDTYDSSKVKLDYHCDGWVNKDYIFDKIGLIGIIGHEKALTKVITIEQIVEYCLANNLGDFLHKLSSSYKYFSKTNLDEIIDQGLIITKDPKAPANNPYLNAEIRFSSYGHITDFLRSPIIAKEALKLAGILNKITPILETCLSSGMVLSFNNKTNLHSRTAFDPNEANFKELTTNKVAQAQASNLYKDLILLRTLGRANIS
jgi:hypothetical protein